MTDLALIFLQPSIDNYGPQDTWTTDHKKHMEFFFNLRRDSNRSRATDQLTNPELSKSRTYFNELRSRIEDSNLTELDKRRIVNIVFYYDIKVMDPKFNKPNAGRRNKNHIHEFMIYLQKEFNSFGKAADYIIKATYTDYSASSSKETLLSSNRAYRRNLRNKDKV